MTLFLKAVDYYEATITLPYEGPNDVKQRLEVQRQFMQISKIGEQPFHG